VFDAGELQRLIDATPGPKQLWPIDVPLGRLETYAYVIDNPECILSFAMQHTSDAT
jgi:hypothetical protein